MAFERRVESDQRRGTGGVAVHEVAPVQMFSTADRTMVPPQPATAEARGASGFRQCPAAMAQILFYANMGGDYLRDGAGDDTLHGGLE